MTATTPSTGTCPAEWRQWWESESRRTGADWASLLGQHHSALLRLAHHHGVKLGGASACPTCGAAPCANPSFCAACRKADTALAAAPKRGGGERRGAAKRTVEALAFQLRAGVNALREQSAQRRISELSEAQMRETTQRLTKERWSKDGTRRVPPWTTDEIESLIELWRGIKT